MKQIFQNLKSGKTEVIEVPTPIVSDGSILIQSKNSLISSGTERMLIEFGKTSLIGKAKSHPDKVLQVLNKIKTDDSKAKVKKLISCYIKNWVDRIQTIILLPR